MVVHAALLMQHAQRFAGNDPLIVAGDYNIQPGTPTYNMITEGYLPRTDPQSPKTPAPFDEAWEPKVLQMRSAYATRNGTEPAITNKATTKRGGGFEGCLDYIWMRGVQKVRSRGVGGGRTGGEGALDAGCGGS